MRLLALALLLLTGACSVFEPTFEASKPGPSGEPPAVVEVDYRGNDGIRSQRLHQQINDYMLDLSRDPGSEAAAYDAMLELEEFYRQRGYPDVGISYEIDPKPKAGAERPRRVKVTFHITEGQQVVVSDLTLTGNTAFSREELMPLWGRRASGVLGFGAPLFVASELEGFANAIGTYYRSRGYLDAEVSAPTIERQDGKARVRIEVHEGKPYLIGEVRVAPNLVEALAGKLPPAPLGKVFSKLRAQEYYMSLRAALRARGRPDPKLRMRTKSFVPNDDTAPYVELDFEGDPGNQRKVTQVVIEGNDETADWVIRDEYPLRPGELFDGAAEDEALRRLYRTGLFRRVHIEHQPIGDDALRVVIAVEELDSRTFDVLAGYGSYERLRGGFRITEANLFGTGRSVSLEGRASFRGYRSALTFTDNDLFRSESQLTLRFDAFRREEPSFTDRAAGFTIGLGRDLTHHVKSRIGYTLRTHSGAHVEVMDPAADLTDYTEGLMFGELINDHRDNLLFPTRGHREFVRADFMENAFGATIGFARVTFGASAYLSLAEDWTVAVNSQQRVLFPEQGSDRVPIPERLFLGGEDTVRSFREDQLGPKDVAGEPRGGEYANLFNLELRFPIWGALQGGVFGDAGNVGSKAQDFGLNGMRYAVGAGLRLALPIGPVRIDAGWKPDRQRDESAYALHFSVGFPF